MRKVYDKCYLGKIQSSIWQNTEREWKSLLSLHKYYVSSCVFFQLRPEE